MIESIDVLMRDGFPTGTRKPKDEIHRDGDWHRAAHVWIVTPDVGRASARPDGLKPIPHIAQGGILLQRRSLRKENNPGLWDVSAAGHLSAGESAIEAAVREVREELGLSIEANELQFLATLRESCVLNEGTYVDSEFHEIFLVRRDVDLNLLTLDPEEVAEVKWVRHLRPDVTFVPHGQEYALLRCLPR